MISNAESAGITEKIIDSLIGSIRFYSDKRMEIDFLYDKDFGLVNKICGLTGIDGLGSVYKIKDTVRYDSTKKGATANG